jgi:hypothetical protein
LLLGAEVGVAAGRGVLVGTGVGEGPPSVGTTVAVASGAASLGVMVGSGSGVGVAGGASGAQPPTSSVMPTTSSSPHRTDLDTLCNDAMSKSSLLMSELCYNEPVFQWLSIIW